MVVNECPKTAMPVNYPLLSCLSIKNIIFFTVSLYYLPTSYIFTATTVYSLNFDDRRPEHSRGQIPP